MEEIKANDAPSFKGPSFFRRVKRFFLHPYQKLTRGFSDRDLWDLNVHLAKLILLRLKAFRKYNLHGNPVGLDFDEWLKILDKMIIALELEVSDFEILSDDYDEKIDERYEQYKEGWYLFTKYFRDLWD